MRRLLVVLLIAIGATGSGCFAATTRPTGQRSPTPPRGASGAPCGTRSSLAPRPHVVWIVLENQGYASVVGSPAAPYLNGLARSCGLATNYAAVAHPSLPNYLAMTSGSTWGIADDAEPSLHPLRVANLFSELHGNWRALEESMPARCDRVTSDDYAARHNPAVYYRNLGASCARNDVPLGKRLDLSARFTFVTPNVCHDMHSCSISTGDAWLSQKVPQVLSSAPYRAGSLVLFITFDESTNGAANRVATIVVAPSVPRGIQVGVGFTHYSLLRTTEHLLRVPYLGAAKRAADMTAPFHL